MSRKEKGVASLWSTPLQDPLRGSHCSQLLVSFLQRSHVSIYVLPYVHTCDKRIKIVNDRVSHALLHCSSTAAGKKLEQPPSKK